MPPTFAYALCAVLWLACACLVWLAAGFMSLVKRTRGVAKRLSLAMAGTFPFVLGIRLLLPYCGNCSGARMGVAKDRGARFVKGD
jgi:hypothetical protein